MLEKVPQLPVDQIDDLIVGCAIPERKQGFNMARLVAARAGLPDSVCGMTINRFCSSGLQAIALAAGQIACGVADVMVAGGVESMTACPVNLDISDTFDPRPAAPAGGGVYAHGPDGGECSRPLRHHPSGDGRAGSPKPPPCGGGARTPVSSTMRSSPLPGVDVDGNPIVFDKDQGIRRSTTLEALAGLKPCFKRGAAL